MKRTFSSGMVKRFSIESVKFSDFVQLLNNNGPNSWRLKDLRGKHLYLLLPSMSIEQLLKSSELFGGTSKNVVERLVCESFLGLAYVSSCRYLFEVVH